MLELTGEKTLHDASPQGQLLKNYIILYIHDIPIHPAFGPASSVMIIVMLLHEALNCSLMSGMHANTMRLQHCICAAELHS